MSGSGPSDVEITAEFDRLLRLARTAGMLANWTLRFLTVRDTGERKPWAIIEDDLVLVVLGFTRGAAMDRLRLIGWVFEYILTGEPGEAPAATEYPLPNS